MRFVVPCMGCTFSRSGGLGLLLSNALLEASSFTAINLGRSLICCTDAAERLSDLSTQFGVWSISPLRNSVSFMWALKVAYYYHCIHSTRQIVYSRRFGSSEGLCFSTYSICSFHFLALEKSIFCLEKLLLVTEITFKNLIWMWNSTVENLIGFRNEIWDWNINYVSDILRRVWKVQIECVTGTLCS